MLSREKKTTAAVFCSLLAALLALTAGLAVAHTGSVRRFNSAEHILRAGEESADCSVEIMQKGSWPKEDALVDGMTQGGQFDVTVSNLSPYEISDWILTINIAGDCCLNQSWNGTVDVSQYSTVGGRILQNLDLHDFSFDFNDVKLGYAGTDKNSLMIPLQRGDSVVYHPKADNTFHEMPLGAAYNGTPGSTTTGMIFYYADGIDLSDYEMVYHFRKSFFEGPMFFSTLAAAALWLLTLIAFAVWAIVTRKAENELRDRERMLEETLELVSHFVDAKDPYTRGHSIRVARYAQQIAGKLGFSERDRRYAFYTGILHDVGKSYVPDEILKKPGRLTDEEYEQIKSHTVHGSEMLAAIKSVPGIADGAYYHHERYDGSGYPTGMAGEDIPLLARIIGVADAFDAMSSTRCYRNRLPKEKILDELERNKEKQFDPKAAEAMIELINSGEVVPGEDVPWDDKGEPLFGDRSEEQAK